VSNTVKYFWVAIASMVIGASFAHADPNSVVVLANKDLPKSIELARYYMSQRGIPENNLITLSMPTDERISRSDYQTRIEIPLKKALRSKKLIKQRMRANILKGERIIHWATSEVNVRYLVCMYGVPVRIMDTKPKVAQAIQNRTGFADKMMLRNGAAVDSELTCLLLEKYERQGYIPNPSYNSFGFQQLVGNQAFLICTRLDGPTPQVVRNMIDGAIFAEKYGLHGGAYVDKYGIYPRGNYWMEKAYQRLKLAGMEIYEHKNPQATWNIDYPMDSPGVYLGWYTEHANGPFKRDDLTFTPGAIAYHLHSFSAMKLRTADEYWVGPLLARGAAATMGCVDEPYLDHTPDLDVFADRLCMGFSFGEAAYMSLSSLSWQITVIGDPLYIPFHPNFDAQLIQSSNDQVQGVDWLILRRVNLLARDSQLNTAMEVCRNGIRGTNSWRLKEKLADLYAANGMLGDARHEYLGILTQSAYPPALARIGAKAVTLSHMLGQSEQAEILKGEVQEKLGESPLRQYLENLAPQNGAAHSPSAPVTPTAPPTPNPIETPPVDEPAPESEAK
jgi:uncharacterized protein (TIGR03790 family)